MPSNFQHITIEDDGRVLAEADVRAEPDVVRAALRVEAGHLPPGTRARLVDAVLDIPDAQPGTRVVVTLPAGDAEFLERIRERCDKSKPAPPGPAASWTPHNPSADPSRLFYNSSPDGLHWTDQAQVGGNSSLIRPGMSRGSVWCHPASARPGWIRTCHEDHPSNE